jgi:hypothetical protein
MRTPHSSTNKGKRVKITLRDGEIIVGKFKEKKGSTIYLETGTTNSIDRQGNIWKPDPNTGFERLTFQMKNVRAFSIYKPHG